MWHKALLCVAAALATALPATAGQSAGGGGLGNILGSGSNPLGGASGYASNLLLSLVDCFELNVGAGAGFKLGFEYAIARTGIGRVDSTRAGFDGRQFGVWTERDAMIGLAPFSLVLAPCELMRGRGETWDGLASAFEYLTMGVERVERDNFSTSTILYHKAVMAGGWHERPGDKYSIGGEAHLVFLGARLRFKPVQFAAFVLGIFGLDISKGLAAPDSQGYYRGTVR